MRRAEVKVDAIVEVAEPEAVVAGGGEVVHQTVGSFEQDRLAGVLNDLAHAVVALLQELFALVRCKVAVRKAQGHAVDRK